MFGDTIKPAPTRHGHTPEGGQLSGNYRLRTDKPAVDILAKEIKDFSKYKIAKAFLRWSRDHDASHLSQTEVEQFENLFAAVNKSLS
ncbi:MAG: hypothetical protein ACK4HD_01480 [Pannonibacter phragmitetus]